MLRSLNHTILPKHKVKKINAEIFKAHSAEQHVIYT